MLIGFGIGVEDGTIVGAAVGVGAKTAAVEVSRTSIVGTTLIAVGISGAGVAQPTSTRMNARERKNVFFKFTSI
jgi:hypothetical protein